MYPLDRRRIAEFHGLEIEAEDRTPVVFRALKVTCDERFACLIQGAFLCCSISASSKAAAPVFPWHHMQAFTLRKHTQQSPHGRIPRFRA